MSIVQDLDKADRAIKDGNIRLSTIRAQRDTIQKEIENLHNIEQQLKENVDFLKKNNIITLAEEFKKAKADLTKTKTRIVMLQNDRERFNKACKEVEILIEEASKKLEQLKKLRDNNVVQGKFGRKNNG